MFLSNSNPLQKFQIAREILKAPVLSIDLFGGAFAQQAHQAFVAPHGRLPWVATKYFGAALIPLENEESAPKVPKYARRRVNRSKKLGQTFRLIDGVSYIDEILEINQSSPVRQNASMEKQYFERDKVRLAAERETPSFGVFSPDGKLLAYTHAPILGDTFVFSYILGHADHLDTGVMFRLIAETNQWMHEHRVENGYPKWSCYDMFFGCSEGLRQFKYRCGFSPYRVHWRWRESGVSA